MPLEVREELEKVFYVVDSEKGSCLEIILLVLEGFLYSARETKVNESVHFELQRIIFCHVKIPDGRTKRTISPKTCRGNFFFIRIHFVMIIFLFHSIMC